jgi:hypothetical protein
MLRSTLIAAGAAVLCSASFAQQALDASKVYPITSPPKDAGVFNVNTRRWISPAKAQAHQAAVGVQVIYNNNCTWSGGGYYTGTGSCEDYIDEGEIPGADNLDFIAEGGTGASATNNVVLFQFGYCTNFAVPDLKIGFYDTLGGQCGGLAASTGAGQPALKDQACPAGQTLAGINPNGKAYYNVGATGLPGDATPGGAAVSCWIVGTFLGNSGFCIKSEGEGTWNNSADLDRFNWSWQMDNLLVAGTAPSGIIISGEPAATSTNTPPIAFGGCTYNLGCNLDPLTGGICGTGRGADDGFWINVDGDKADGTTNTGVACVSAPAAGTTCYWFNGYPGNPYGSFWMVMLANGGCDGVVPVVNGNGCTGQTANTAPNGCMSSVSWVGLPSANQNSGPFNISFSGLNGGVNGVVFYGIMGRVNVPWSSISNLCVKSPTQRLNGYPGAFGGTGGALGSCAGGYTFDFNPILNGSSSNGGNPWLGQSAAGMPFMVGQAVDMQAWNRDTGNPKTTVLSQKLHFQVGL